MEEEEDYDKKVENARAALQETIKERYEKTDTKVYIFQIYKPISYKPHCVLISCYVDLAPNYCTFKEAKQWHLKELDQLHIAYFPGYRQNMKHCCINTDSLEFQFYEELGDGEYAWDISGQWRSFHGGMTYENKVYMFGVREELFKPYYLTIEGLDEANNIIEALDEFASTSVNKVHYNETLTQLINELKEHFEDAKEFL
jgi:hypothetical protein